MWDNLEMPIIHVMTSGGLGNQAEVDVFNYFFTLVIAMMFVLFIPVVITKILNRS